MNDKKGLACAVPGPALGERLGLIVRDWDRGWEVIIIGGWQRWRERKQESVPVAAP